MLITYINNNISLNDDTAFNNCFGALRNVSLLAADRRIFAPLPPIIATTAVATSDVINAAAFWHF
jgi:hypothetical protein